MSWSIWRNVFFFFSSWFKRFVLLSEVSVTLQISWFIRSISPILPEPSNFLIVQLITSTSTVHPMRLSSLSSTLNFPSKSGQRLPEIYEHLVTTNSWSPLYQSHLLDDSLKNQSPGEIWEFLLTPGVSPKQKHQI